MPDTTQALPIPPGLKHRHMHLMGEIRRGDTIQRTPEGRDIVRRSKGRSGRCDKDVRDLHPTYATLEGTDGRHWRLTPEGDQVLDAFLAVRNARIQVTALLTKPQPA